MAASVRTWVRSIAARTTFGFSKACAYSSPRAASQLMSSATVAIPSGGSISSSVLPTRSRTHAKYRTFTRSILDQVLHAGAEIIPAGIERQQCRAPEQRKPNRGNHGNDGIARAPGDEKA